MSAYLKRGIVVWILGFITFLAALNTLYAVRLGALENTGSAVQLYIISDITEILFGTQQIRVMHYFWASTIVTFVFLGFTAIAANRKLPLDPAMVKMFVKLDANLTANRKTLSEGLEENKGAIEVARTDVLEVVEGYKKPVKDSLAPLEMK